MQNVKATQLRAATTAGAGDMAATGTHALQGWGSPFKIQLGMVCANAYAFTITFRKDNAAGEVIGEIAISQSTTPDTKSFNFDPREVKNVYWAIVGTAPAGAITLWMVLLEELQKTK